MRDQIGGISGIFMNSNIKSLLRIPLECIKLKELLKKV